MSENTEAGGLVDAQTEARAIVAAEGDDVEWFHPDEVVRMIATALAAKDDELADIRSVLASIEVCSLPDDFPTIEMAKLRMQTLNERTLDGLAAIGRAERAETALAEALKVLEPFAALAPETEALNCNWVNLTYAHGDFGQLSMGDFRAARRVREGGSNG